MSGVSHVSIEERDDGMRLDRWFHAHYPAVSFSRLQKLLRTGQVRLDGGRAKCSTRVAAGQVVRVPPMGEPSQRSEFGRGQTYRLSESDAEMMHTLVLHQDDDIIILNKPPGLPVQGGIKSERNIDAMLDAFSSGSNERARLVHRLDRDTSGVLVLARNRRTANALTTLFNRRQVRKVYWALVVGVPHPDEGRIDLALAKRGRQGEERVRPASPEDADAQRAITEYVVISKVGRSLAWLAMMPVTGRTHQLRAHAAAIGHPIVGDGKYGGSEAHPGGAIARRLHLHSREVLLPHPSGGELRMTAPLPPHMEATFKDLGLSPDEAEHVFSLVEAPASPGRPKRSRRVARPS